VITAPQIVGSCNSFDVSSILSYGNAGRDFIWYQWTVSPAIPAIALAL